MLSGGMPPLFLPLIARSRRASTKVCGALLGSRFRSCQPCGGLSKSGQHPRAAIPFQFWWAMLITILQSKWHSRGMGTNRKACSGKSKMPDIALTWTMPMLLTKLFTELLPRKADLKNRRKLGFEWINPNSCGDLNEFSKKTSIISPHAGL